MRNTIFTLLLLIGTQTAMAATITARISANVLEPVKISFQTQNDKQDFAAIDGQQNLAVESARNLRFELTHKPSDVCLFSAQDSERGEPKMALASCETYTVNFN